MNELIIRLKQRGEESSEKIAMRVAKAPTEMATAPQFDTIILNDDLIRNKIPVIKPEKFVLLEALSKDTNFIFIDDISTDQLETLNDQVTIALKKASLAEKRAAKC